MPGMATRESRAYEASLKELRRQTEEVLAQLRRLVQ
jgi:hypothetical protein